MLALTLRDGAARLETDYPEAPRGPGEARVRVRLAGICDTDLQLARGYMGFAGVPGHEFVGEVIECDEPTRWLGRRVVADINAGCGACARCATPGGNHHCETRTVLGILGRQGALAETLVVPERCLVEVPAGVPDERAVFAEPLAAALHVGTELELVLATGREPIYVVGDGKLGLLCALALHASGAAVTLVGHHVEKMARFTDAGMTTVLERELTADHRGRGALVVEASGSASGLALSLSLARPRGTVVLKTTVAGPTSVDLSPVVIHELRVVGSRCGDMALAVQRLAEGHIDPTPLIAARYPLREAERALRHAGERGVLKVLVENRGRAGGG